MQSLSPNFPLRQTHIQRKIEHFSHHFMIDNIQNQISKPHAYIYKNVSMFHAYSGNLIICLHLHCNWRNETLTAVFMEHFVCGYKWF